MPFMSVMHTRTVTVHTPSEFQDGRVEFNVNVVESEIIDNRETILLLHGYLGSTEDYNLLMNEFNDEFNVIAIDLRGHGLSDIPKEEDHLWTLDNLAYDIESVLSSIVLNGTKVHIVGSSLSTAIAVRFTKNFPELVKSLFLISPTQEFILPNWMKLMLGIQKISPDFISRFFIDLVGSIATIVQLNKDEKKIIRRGRQRLKEIEISIHRKILLETIKSWELDLRSLNKPVMIVAGEKDKIIPLEKSLDFNEQVSRSSIFILKNTKHQILLRRPGIISVLLQSWLHNADDWLSLSIRTEDELPQDFQSAFPKTVVSQNKKNEEYR